MTQFNRARASLAAQGNLLAALAGFVLVATAYGAVATPTADACTYMHWQDGCTPSGQTYVARRWQMGLAQYANTYYDWWVYDSTKQADAQLVVNTYEAVLPIQQFNYTTVEADAEVRIKHGNYCPLGSPACLLATWIDDTTRGGKYVSGADIRLQTYSWDYTTNGWRAAVAHEMGHFHGLAERSDENESSVMDKLACGVCAPPGCSSSTKCTAIGHTNSIYPTSWDTARIQDFYHPKDSDCTNANTSACKPAQAEPRVSITYVPTLNYLSMDYWDTSFAEKRFELSWWRKSGSVWVRVDPGFQYYTVAIATWGDWRGEGQDSDPARRFTPLQDGWYTVCVLTVNAVYDDDDGIDGLAFRCAYPTSGVYVNLP